MRILIESTAPGLFRVAYGRDGEHRITEHASREEVQILTSMLLNQENKRNRVADRVPYMERTVRIPVPNWLPWPKKPRK